jgi:hypothetical protein
MPYNASIPNIIAKTDTESKVSPFSRQIKKSTRVKETFIKYFFAVNGVMALVFIILIFVFLFKEGFQALEHIGIMDFFYNDQLQADGSVKRVFQWYPTSSNPRYSGVYLAEIANPKAKEFLKPIVNYLQEYQQ